MLISPSGVFMRVPERKQLQPTAVAHTARAGELRAAKPNPNATPAHSFQPAIKLRRDVASVAFSLVEGSRKFFSSGCRLMSQPPNRQSARNRGATGKYITFDPLPRL